VASGPIIASLADACYFESLSSERHRRKPGDSWRHLRDNERHLETLEVLEPFSKYVLDVYMEWILSYSYLYLHFAMLCQEIDLSIVKTSIELEVLLIFLFSLYSPEFRSCRGLNIVVYVSVN